MNILEIEILTDNIDNTEKFYSGTLGFKMIYKSPDCLSYSTGSSTLTFRKSFNENPIYHVAFNIPNNKLEETINWTSSKFDLIKVDSENTIADFKSWNAKAIYFYDNNGNILEFIARFDLDNKSVEPFEISSIQSISEMGIVTDDVPAFCNQLIKEENIPLFNKGTRDENFTAMGDDNGLFIIVKTNRKWFPTFEQRAVKHYTRVKISVDGTTKELIFDKQNDYPLSK